MKQMRAMCILVGLLFLIPLFPISPVTGDAGGGDAGDDFNTATLVSAGSSLTGTLDSTLDIDYYRFQVNEGQGINVSLWWTSSNTWHFMEMYSYDPDGTYDNYAFAYGTGVPAYITAAGEKTGQWRIKIFYGSGDIPGAYTFKVTLFDPPTPPALYSPTGITESAMSISWSQYGGTDFKAYKIYSGTQPDSKVFQDGITSKATTSYQFTGLSPSTAYYIRVRVDTTRLSFAYSAQVSGTTLAKYDPSTKTIEVVLYAPTEITDSTMTLTWNRYTETDFASYELHRSTTTGFAASAGTKVADVQFVDQTSYSVTGLSASTAYYWLVRVRNFANDYFTSQQSSGTTLSASEAPPPKVTLNSPAAITTSSMTISWSQTSAPDFYMYELHVSTVTMTRPDSSTLKASFYKAGSTTFTVSGLTEDTLYYFMVSTYDKYMLHSESDAISARTLYVNKAPAPVQVSDVSTVTNDLAVIDWTQNQDKDFSKYEVHLGTSVSFSPSPSTLKATITERATTSYSLADLAPDTDYYVIVRGIDSGSLYTDSNPVVHFKTLAGNQPPQTPVLGAATDITAVEASITWQPNTDTDFARYELHMATDDGSFTPSAATLVATYALQTQTSHHFAGLAAGKTYYIKLRVYDGHELYTDSSSVSFMTLSPPSITITLFTPVNITGSSMTVFWTVDKPDDVSKYEVHMSQTPGFTPGPTTIYTTITQKKTRSIDVAGLAPGTSYYFRLKAYDISGSSTSSMQVSAMTSRTSSGEGGTAVLYSPTLMTRDTAMLEWEEAISLDFVSYEVHRSENAGFTPGPSTLAATIKDKSVTTWTVLALKPLTGYYFQLKIVSDKSALLSQQVSGTTLPSSVTFPDPVALERPTKYIGTGSRTLTWTKAAAKDFLKYEVHVAEYGNFTPTRGTLVKTIYGVGTTTADIPFDRDTSHYKVRVYNTYWLYSDSRELTADPTGVVLMDIFVAGERDLRVQWTENPDVDFKAYTLYMSKDKGFIPVDSTKVARIERRDNTTYTVTGLKPDKPYYFVVKVENEVGLEVLSNGIEARTLKQDRSKELYGLAMTGIYLALAAVIIIIICIVLILFQASRISRLKREAMARDLGKEDVRGGVAPMRPAPPPPVAGQMAQAPPPPPPPGPPRSDMPYVEAYIPEERRR
jgi:titin